MMNEEIRSIMTDNPVTVSPTQKLSDVADIFKQKRIHHIPVTENGQLVGLLTTYDLWKLDKAQEGYSKIQVQDAMSTKICKISPIDKVGTAAELLMDRRFHALPVVNLRGELKGIVTSFDIMKYTLNRNYPTPILYKDELNNENTRMKGIRVMS